MQKAYPKRVRSQNGIFYYKTGLKMRFLSKMWAQNLTKAIYIYIYIYIHAVESKLDPRFGFFLSQNLVQGCVKAWSKICLVCFSPNFIVFWV